MYRLTSFFLLIFFIHACTIPPTSPQAEGERRVALVIGNAAYPSPPKGNNLEKYLSFDPILSAKQDAEDMTDNLRKLGFSVLSVQDANKQKMQKVLNQFREELEKAPAKTVGLFYFSGHGLADMKGDEEGKEAYLIPSNKVFLKNSSKDKEFIALTQVYEAMNVENKLNFVILDNCRNNNEAGQQTQAGDKGLFTMKGPSGKIEMESGANPGKDKNRPLRTIIAYATEQDKTSLGINMPGQNSFYTAQLLKHLSIPGLPIQELFPRVSNAVMEETKKIKEKMKEINKEIIVQRPYFDFGEISSEELEFVFKKGAVQIMPSPP